MSAGAGGLYTFALKPNVANVLREEAVTQALETIERRVNELGVSEPNIARQGEQDQLLVQLPGVTDVQRAKDLISTTAVLELRYVDRGPFPSRELVLQQYNNNLPSEFEILPGKVEGVADAGVGQFYAVRKAAVVAGNDLRSAAPSLDEYNRPSVSFTLKQDAAARFGSFTESNIGRCWASCWTGASCPSPTIQSRITDSGQITGLGQAEVQDLVITLKSGALPASLSYLEERTVGPSLGAGFDQGRRHGVDRWPRDGRAVHAGVLQVERHQCRRVDSRQPDHPARPDGVLRRHHDAARALPASSSPSAWASTPTC